MKNKNIIIVFVTLLTLTVLSRWVSHIWNFTLLGGAFLFAGSYFRDKKVSVILMFVSLLISDFILGFHNQMLAVYCSYLIIVALGFMLNANSNRFKILGLSVLGSLSFYLITNFAVWYEGSMYPMTLSGLIECYLMAIPFYRNQLISDVISSFAFFEAAKLIQGQIFQSAEVSQKAE